MSSTPFVPRKNFSPSAVFALMPTTVPLSTTSASASVPVRMSTPCCFAVSVIISKGKCMISMEFFAVIWPSQYRLFMPAGPLLAGAHGTSSASAIQSMHCGPSTAMAYSSSGSTVICCRSFT